jgi:DNA polymerase III epsilon subunit-like protein
MANSSESSLSCTAALDAYFSSLPENIVFSDSEYLHEAMLPPNAARPLEHHWKRVTQLAGVKVMGGAIVGTFCQLVSPGPPRDYPDDMWKVHEQITHLPTAKVQQARLLPEVYASFKQFCGNDCTVMVMLGDHEVHRRNMLEYGLDISAVTSRFLRLRPALAAIDPKTYSTTCSGELHRLVGLTPEDVLRAYGAPSGSAAAHDALFDSTSMALFVEGKRKELKR